VRSLYRVLFDEATLSAEYERSVRMPWPVMASSLWLRGGLAAAGLSAYGVAVIFEAAQGTPAAGLAFALGGAVAAYVAIRRAWRLLQDGDHALAREDDRKATRPPGWRRALRV
jgi:hypothetical protein